MQVSIKFIAYEFLSLALQTFGSFAALPITPYVSDGLGRRTSIFIGALVLCVATAIQTTANSMGMFIAARYASHFVVLEKILTCIQSLDWIWSSLLHHRCSLVDH